MFRCQDLPREIAAPIKVPTRKNKCGICHGLGHNKKNYPASTQPVVGKDGKESRKRKFTPKMAELVEPQLDTVDSDIEEGSSVGTIGSMDSAEDVAAEQNLNDLVWDECINCEAAVDEDGDEVLPPIDFLVEKKGPVKEMFTNITDPLNFVAQFNFYWKIPMCQQMISSTNSYGETNIKGWKKLGPSEFLAFLGVITYMGIVTYTSRKAYWQHGIKGCEYIKRIMSRDRFQQICRAWHYEKQDQFTQDELKALRKKDPFWAIKSFCNELSENYDAAWTPGQNIDIDEQCIPWKGRHKCRTYNPNKPVKWHFKVLSLNCSATAYQSAFYLYQGKAEQRPAGITATAYPAHQLLQNPKYHNKGYILYTDNWFTSFQQLQICNARGIEMVGTIKANRGGIPDTFKIKGCKKQVRVRGEHVSKKTVYANKLVYFTCWLDKKPVQVLHTIPTAVGTCRRLVSQGEGNWTRKTFTRPTIINQYNKGMGGTDSGDQRIASYRSVLKTNSWIPRCFSHCLNSALVNLWILLSITGCQAFQKAISSLGRWWLNSSVR